MAPPSEQCRSPSTTDTRWVAPEAVPVVGRPTARGACPKDRLHAGGPGAVPGRDGSVRGPTSLRIGFTPPIQRVAVQRGPEATSSAAKPVPAVARSPEDSRWCAIVAAGAKAFTTMSPTRTTRRRPGWSVRTTGSAMALPRVPSSGLMPMCLVVRNLLAPAPEIPLSWPDDLHHRPSPWAPHNGAGRGTSSTPDGRTGSLLRRR
jgi:hypothetical protein